MNSSTAIVDGNEPATWVAYRLNEIDIMPIRGRILPSANHFVWSDPISLRLANSLIIGTLLIVLTGCTEPSTPEAEIRALIAKVEIAAEARDLGDIRPLIAESYTDRRGYNKPEIEQLLRLVFVTHRSVHLQIYVETIEFVQPDIANAVALVGMADTAGALPDVDLYQFDARLIRNDDEEWQLIEADWRRGLGKAPER